MGGTISGTSGFLNMSLNNLDTSLIVGRLENLAKLGDTAGPENGALPENVAK